MVTAAVIGGVGAIGGAIIGGKSAEKAAKTGAEAQERAADTVSAAAERARSDVLSFFPEARKNLFAGAQGAIDVFGAGIPIAQKQLQAGNIQAQETIARGFSQQQAALLGLPVEAFQAGAPIFTDDEPLLGQDISKIFGQSDIGKPVQTKDLPDFGATGSTLGQGIRFGGGLRAAAAQMRETPTDLGQGVAFGGGLRQQAKKKPFKKASIGRK